MHFGIFKKACGVLIMVLTLIASSETVLQTAADVPLYDQEESLSLWNRIGLYFQTKKEQRIEKLKTFITDISS